MKILSRQSYVYIQEGLCTAHSEPLASKSWTPLLKYSNMVIRMFRFSLHFFHPLCTKRCIKYTARGCQDIKKDRFLLKTSHPIKYTITYLYEICIFTPTFLSVSRKFIKNKNKIFSL